MHLSTDFYDGIVDSGLIAGNVKITMSFPVWNEKSIIFLRLTKLKRRLLLHRRNVTYTEATTKTKELRGNVNYLSKQS